MWAPVFELTVTEVKAERKTFRDKINGATREYETFTIAGINLKNSTMAILNVVEEIRNQVRDMKLESGSLVNCSLRQMEYDKGLLRGTVIEVKL